MNFSRYIFVSELHCTCVLSFISCVLKMSHYLAELFEALNFALILILFQVCCSHFSFFSVGV